MISSSDKEYLATKEVKLGNKKMKSEFIPLAEWINETFDVNTLNIIYDKLYDGSPRVQICFEFEEEKKKFLTQGIPNYDKEKQKLVAEKFKEIIGGLNLEKSTSSLLCFFKKKTYIKYLLDDVFVIFSAFEEVAKQEVTSKITKAETEEFINSFNNEDIWTISIAFTIPTFFMFTENQVKEYNNPELKKLWADKYFDLIKPFDEFNYFKRKDVEIFIDSKENFDNNYESNWYYYYK